MVVTEQRTADWLRLVCGEYLEMPGLSLTRPQVRRLWGLDDPTCEELLGELVDCGFLRLTDRGTYVRAGAA